MPGLSAILQIFLLQPGLDLPSIEPHTDHKGKVRPNPLKKGLKLLKKKS
jgi:hypothetical protein